MHRDRKDGTLMAATRNVKQNPAGEWEVLKEGHLRAPVTSGSEQKAVSQAREQVRREGGGEVRVFDRTGKIVKASHVAARATRARTRKR
jgi:Uncharacterized protein conserved in bacteria (DUF2188)